jgi:murein DD-endopeptidase MepM/ murein hydrolase activator NlpD
MIAAGTSALVAGCSDATRFSADPFSNPFQTSSARVDRAPTGSVAKPRAEASAIQSRPLAPLASSQASAPPPQAPPPMSAGAGSSDHWSIEGGTPVVVAQGETAAMVASRYGVPADALLRVNGFASAQQVQPGSRLVIPVYHAVAAKPAGAARSAAAEPQKSERKQSAKAPASKAAQRDDAPRKGKDKRADAKLAKSAQASEEKAGATPSMAKSKLARSQAAVEPKAEAPVEKRNSKTAAAEPPVETTKADKAPTSSIPQQQDDKPSASSDAAHPEFRWPARGRIIQGFSGGNDGINISVPEGTSIKAAEGGVVAYAGNELKGYGNLVLIRHPNGFVSAYAHNGQLDVKRGDQVKRGQIIAKSGQSGNVGSPQLHFELRKGSTPVDPTNYLAGL